MEDWKILARQVASSWPSSLRSRLGILSGLDALLILRWDSNLATPGGLMCKEEILGWVGPGSSGMENRSLSVNTDSNYSLSIFALSELSGKRIPFFFKGATPGESLRVDLMYFQKGLVSPSSKALLIMPSMKRPRALLSSLLACLLQALYRAQAWLDLAFFAFLCRCCLRLQMRLMEFVNQGTCLLLEESLLGICDRTSSKNDLGAIDFDLQGQI